MEYTPIDANSVNILGTEYIILKRSEKDDKLLNVCDGYCDCTTKQIVVKQEMCGNLGNMDFFIKKVIRHEIIHAFAIESGLRESSLETAPWATNEEMIDWFARQGPKIYKAWQEADAL